MRISAPGTSGAMLRRLIPAAFIIPAVVAWLAQEGEIHGVYKDPVGLAVMAVVTTISLTLVIVLTGRSLAAIERELRESQANYRNLFESAPVGLSHSRADGAIVVANDACVRMFGYRDVEALKCVRADDFYVRAEDRIRLRDGMAATGVAFIETELKRADGSVIWVQLHSRLVGEGSDARFENALIDITQRKQLEGQFIQAQKMEAVGRLAGGIAHDFNNLLTVIRSYCDLVLLELPATATNRADLQEIAGAADRASVLARQLLAFSRRQVLLPQVLDTNAVVEQVQGILRRVMPSAVTFSARLADDLGSIRGDPGHIDQLLMNLAINATDAMPAGGRLSIETANVTLDDAYAAQHSGMKAGDYVMIAVSDTGTGMDAATQAKIFEPFFTTKAPGKGTGLGLATVYAIVEQNHGHIWVYSEVGEGTTFKIYFPRVAEAAEALPSRRPVGMRKQDGPVRTVLVVEDDDAVRATIATVLERQGYRVLQAHHGGDGLRVSATHDGDIDLVISDVMMPELGGREFVERLVKTRARTRVLLMSGYTDDDILQRGLINPAFAFMEKPFAVEQLVRKIEEVLSG